MYSRYIIGKIANQDKETKIQKQNDGGMKKNYNLKPHFN